MRKMREIVEMRSIRGTRTMDGRNRWTDLRQIHTEDVFGPSLESECQGQRSKVKVTRDKKRAVYLEHSRRVVGMERPRCR